MAPYQYHWKQFPALTQSNANIKPHLRLYSGWCSRETCSLLLLVDCWYNGVSGQLFYPVLSLAKASDKSSPFKPFYEEPVRVWEKFVFARPPFLCDVSASIMHSNIV